MWFVCGQSAARANPAPEHTPGAGGALDTPPVRPEGDPTAVDFRIVSAYGRYDPEPGTVYGRVMNAAGELLEGIVVEVYWEERAAQTTTGPDGQFLFQCTSRSSV